MIACCRNGDRAARDYLLAAIIATSPDGSAALLARSPFKRYQADKPLACYVFDQVCGGIRIFAKTTTRARMAVPKIAPRYNFEIKTQAWPQEQPARRANFLSASPRLRPNSCSKRSMSLSRMEPPSPH